MTVDLTALRNLTAGDPALEQEMFGLFYNTARRCLENALYSLRDDKSDVWQNAMQELQGAARNIGAYELAGACRVAENTQELNQRKLLLNEVGERVQEAQSFLQSVTY